MLCGRVQAIESQLATVACASCFGMMFIGSRHCPHCGAAATDVAAADLATDHQLGIWDAVILSAASQSGCRLLLSEDLQEGFTWAGLTVVNPFASPRHALLHALLGEDDE